MLCRSSCLQLLLLLIPSTTHAREIEFRGRVIDESGKPVAGAAVDHFWSANGTGKNSDGRPLDRKNERDLRLYWGHLGQMEPRNGAATQADGSFSLKLLNRTYAVMAMDSARQLGGVAIIPKDEHKPEVEIRLAPLVRVHGKFEGPRPETQPDWTHVYVRLHEDPTRPLDDFDIAHCGSFERRFEVWLPPGKYQLYAYGQTAAANGIDLAVVPNPEIVVSGESRALDVGTLRLRNAPPSQREQRVARAKAAGSFVDLTKRFGERPPRWHVVDARGVKKSVQPADFQGKWLLVDFWGFSCVHCLADDLPRLDKFYQEHAAQRDQFEILAFCIDSDHELKSLDDVDRLLAPIVKHVWGGKSLSFPMLLDPTFTTAERYGLEGYGTIVLIDPAGNLVEGDETTLAKRLRK